MTAYAALMKRIAKVAWSASIGETPNGSGQEGSKPAQAITEPPGGRRRCGRLPPAIASLIPAPPDGTGRRVRPAEFGAAQAASEPHGFPRGAAARNGKVASPVIDRTSCRQPSGPGTRPEEQDRRHGTKQGNVTGEGGSNAGRNRPTGPMRRASRCEAPPGATKGALGRHHRDQPVSPCRNRQPMSPGKGRQAKMGPAAASAPYSFPPLAGRRVSQQPLQPPQR